METVTEITESGVSKEIQRKVFPGYVLIKMVMTDDTWHLIRNIRGVTGFVGEANKAIPLTEDEVAALGMEKREIVVLYHVGDTVRITEGTSGQLYRHGGGDRTGQESCPRGGLHVRPRNAGGSGAGSGRGQQQLSTAQPYRPEQYDSGASGRDARHLAKSGSGMDRPLPHFIEGGAYKWHRK